MSNVGGRKFMSDKDAGMSLLSGSKFMVKAVPHDSDEFEHGMPRALLVGTEGAATLLIRDPSDPEAVIECEDVPLQQGYNYLRPVGIKTGGTADDIWLLY